MNSWGEISQPALGKSLGEVHPELIDSWSIKNSLTPFDYSPKSGKKVFWTCKEHGDWGATIANRSNGRGCPGCGRINRGLANSKPPLGKSLGEVHPELVKQWSINNELTPFDYYPQSNKKVLWTCEEHGEWRASPNHRSNGSGCPSCGRIKRGIANSKPKEGKSLGDVHPELIDSWSINNELTPFDYYPQSNKKVFWTCGEHGDWEASPDCRNKGSGCPDCGKIKRGISRAKPKEGESLGEKYPELIEQWSINNELTPFDYSPKSHKKVLWTCKEHGDWEAYCYTRAKDLGSGCPSCCLNQTSQVEISLREKLGAWPSSARLGKHQVDILLPESKTIVEYDGAYWHQDRMEADSTKTLSLLEKGYKVIRIRTIPLPPLQIDNPNYLEIYFEDTAYEAPEELVKLVEEGICELSR